MRLQEHSALRFVAIVLFCAELLAPSVASAFQTETSKKATEHTVLSITHAATINSLFVEEEIEEERDSKNHTVLTFHFHQGLHSRCRSNELPLAFGISYHQQKYQTQPLLFKRHCRYTI